MEGYFIKASQFPPKFGVAQQKQVVHDTHKNLEEELAQELLQRTRQRFLSEAQV